MRFFLLLFVVLTTISCKQDSTNSGVKKNPDSILHLPPLSDDLRMELFRNALSVDIIAYNLPVSMSFTDPGSIQSIISFVSPTQGVWKAPCKSVGRISFMYENGVGQEAEMLIHQGCATLVWVKDNKNVMMNLLTTDGVEYFNRFMPEDGNIKLPEQGQKK